MHFQNKAYWWEIGDALKPAMELNTFPDSTDFVVVGAGYAGLSAALTIARQGQSVVVIDSGMQALELPREMVEFAVGRYDRQLEI